MSKTIVGIGQIDTMPSVMNRGPVTPVPQLIETDAKLVMRPRTSAYPGPTVQGAYCWPVRNACFTSQQTKDQAEAMCDSGERPTKDPGSGCPIGSPRIDPYGSGGETSASSFDPCLIRDFPVCSGGSRFGDLRRWTAPAVLEYQGIFGVEGNESDEGDSLKMLGVLALGAGAGFLIGKWVLR